MIASVQSKPSTGVVAAPSPERQAFGDLAKSLRSGDVDGAKQAYASLVRNAPEGATWPKGSDFADLGKALVQGDLDAARTAFASMVKGKFEQHHPVKGGGVVQVDSTDAAASGSAGGESGSLLNVVA